MHTKACAGPHQFFRVGSVVDWTDARAVIVYMAALLLASGVQGCSRRDQPAPVPRTKENLAPLSEEQTLGLIFADFEWEGESRIPLYSKSSPEVAPQVRAIIRNAEYMKYHYNAYTALAYIGDAADVQFVEEMLASDVYAGRRQTSGEAGQIQDSVRGAVQCLGILTRREISGARDAMLAAINANYWTSKRIHALSDESLVSVKARIEQGIGDDTTLEFLSIENQVVAHLVRAAAMSGDPQVVTRLRERIEDMTVVAGRDLYKDALERGLMAFSAKVMRELEGRPLDPRKRSWLATNMQGTLDDPTPAEFIPQRITD